jgi:iron complex outermembrane receptor protein
VAKSLVVAASLVAGCLPHAAYADPTGSRKVSFVIASQNLGDALTEFALQTKQQILYSPPAVEGRRTLALRGAYTVNQALSRLLSGSGLSSRTSTGGAILLVATRAEIPREADQPRAVLATANADTPRSGAVASEEIVVTAQRRAENLQKVPISVTAVPSSTLAQLNLKSVNDVQLVTPGLSFDKGYNYAVTYIRGIGANIVNVGLENPVAVYVDGSYVQRSIGTVGDLFDINQLQVLKGAQGTLYGRNASGGAILIQTADPELGRSELKLASEYGNLGHASGSAIVNVPLASDLALRLGAYENHDSGYVTNDTDGFKFGGRTTYILRGKLKWQPSSNLSAILESQYYHSIDFSNALAERFPAPICLACAIYGIVPLNGKNDFYRVDTNNETGFATKIYSTSLRLGYKVGAIDISSVTAYRDDKTNGSTDQDFTRAPFFLFGANTGGKEWTEDVQAVSNFGGMINGLIGFSYLHDAGFYSADLTGNAYAAILPIAGATPQAQTDVITRSYAVFGELYVTPLDRLKITLGGRFVEDKRTLSASENVAANIALAGGLTPATFRQQADFRAFTPRAVIAYDLGRTNIYASWSRGFKAGGFVTPVFAPTNIVKPEKIDSFEVGAKYVSPDRRFRANAATFYYKYREIQVNILDIASGGERVENAAGARGYGVEIDSSYLAAKWLNLFANAAYLNARFTTYPDASVVVLSPTGGLTAGVEDLSGSALPHSPKVTLSAGVNLKATLGREAEGSLNIVARHSGSYDFYAGASGPLRYDRQPKTTVVNITGDVGPQAGPYKVGFFINNATGQRYYIQRSTSQPFGVFDQVAKPRSYGMRVAFDFR